jgi:hypothetical protein
MKYKVVHKASGSDTILDTIWLYVDGQLEVAVTYSKLTGIVSMRGFNHKQEPLLLARFRMDGQDQEGVLQL